MEDRDGESDGNEMVVGEDEADDGNDVDPDDGIMGLGDEADDDLRLSAGSAAGGAVPAPNRLDLSGGLPVRRQPPGSDKHDAILEKLRMSMKNKKQNNLPNTSSAMGSKLTLEEIRKGLRGGGSKDSQQDGRSPQPQPPAGSLRPTRQDSNSENINENRFSQGIFPPNLHTSVPPFAASDLRSNASSKSGGGTRHATTATVEERKMGQQTLSQLCEEVLVYCSLLDSSRLRAVEEGTRLQKTLRHLEALLDAAPQREMEHLNQVDQLRQMHTGLDQKYRALKSRAKQLIRECQEARDRRQTEYQKANTHLQSLESELFSLQTLVANQRKELERAREANLNLKSPRDVADLDLRLRKLEKDNNELRAEKARVQQHHDELKQSLSMLTNKFGGTVPDAAKSKATIQQMEQMHEDMLEEKRLRAEANERELQKIRSDRDRYSSYAEELLRRLDEETEGIA